MYLHLIFLSGGLSSSFDEALEETELRLVVCLRSGGLDSTSSSVSSSSLTLCFLFSRF